MNRKVALIVGLQAFLIIVLFWVLVFYGKDEYDSYNQAQEEEVATPNRVNQVKGATVVTLSQEAQQQSDIQTLSLNTSQHQKTLNALGNVISIDTLIELRTRYLNAKANANIARASLVNSKQDYQRMQTLNKDDRNVSDQVMLAAQAAFKGDQAKEQAAETEANNLNDTMRQTWGEILAKEATKDPASGSLQALLLHKEVLLLITLPADINVKVGDSIKVVPTGTKTKSISAKLVSASPQTDSTIQGRTYYFRAPAENLRAGMRVSVEMKDASNSQPSNGVTVPASAVVWYAGKPWVYKKQDHDHFIRLPINTDNESNGGWFNRSEQLTSGDSLVVNGAQLLLSEEFKYQIKNENQD
jgi:membrane fusion protein, multidrug efflux system